MIDPITASNQQNSLVNQAATAGLPQRIEQAIKTAAARTGVDFSYLLNKASQESSLDPNARAGSSSATGLFQFTNQTWLQMVKAHGAQYGLGNYADHIQIDNNGVAHVGDPNWRQAILALRKDPQISAEMAGELDKQNLQSLKTNVGGKLGATELYLAHFLGAGGASDFLNSMRKNPNVKAASILPDAAAANPAVFYTSSGQPRSLAQIYQHFAEKFNGSATAAIAVASAQGKTRMPYQLQYQTTSPSAVQTASYATASAAYSGSSLTASQTYAYMTAPRPQASMFSDMVLAGLVGDKAVPAIGTGTANASHHAKRDDLALLGGVA